ncbi:hypothetical protein SAMN04488595_11697 [Ralstonia sp. 25mfcol4.1]|nr:hypothetical protein SAMN04488595_11697 [Ralstonia sp. 25mfcol4.1]
MCGKPVALGDNQYEGILHYWVENRLRHRLRQESDPEIRLAIPHLGNGDGGRIVDDAHADSRQAFFGGEQRLWNDS